MKVNIALIASLGCILLNVVINKKVSVKKSGNKSKKCFSEDGVTCHEPPF
jgi:hypothetical protein